MALKAGLEVVGRVGGRLAAGKGGACAGGAAGLSSGHASVGAALLVELVFLPYNDAADAVGLTAGGGAGFGAGGALRFKAAISTFPTGV